MSELAPAKLDTNKCQVVIDKSTIISIDRTVPFDPAEFISKGWSIVEEDERSLALTELDLSKVSFESMLNQDQGETSIKGEVKLKRLKVADHIRLDAKIFLTLWENQQLIPGSWKEKINGSTRYNFFDGTILLGPLGDRCVIYLFWDGGRWRWDCYWLGLCCWCANFPSVVLVSK